MTATRMLNAAPPPVQRLSILLLAVPLIVWTATWLDWRLAVPLTAALLHPLVRLCRGPWREWARPFQPALGLLAALFALTSVPGGINWVSGDFWDFHALLRALADGPWPSALDASLYPEPVLMRRYMGWYLWPAMTARPFGGAALSVIVPLYMTACGWLALALLCGNRTPREAFPGGLVFLGSWGMYLAMWIVGNLVEVHEQHLWGTVYLPRFGHWFAAALQPHHWLPAVLGATLAVQTASSAATRTHRMPILVPAVVFWSPWATAGLIPVGLWWLHRRRGDFRPADLAAALPATLVAGVCVSAYLLSGATDFYRGWLWTHLKPVDVLLWMALPLITAAPHAYLLWDRDNAVPASLRRLAFGMLLVVPLWHMGSVNDWTPNTLLVPATVLGMAWLNRLWRWGRDNRGGAVGLVLFVACLQLAGHLLWSTTYDNQTLPNYAEPPRHDELALAWQAENVAPHAHPALVRMLRDVDLRHGQPAQAPPDLSGRSLWLWGDHGLILSGACDSRPGAMLRIVGVAAAGKDSVTLTSVERSGWNLAGGLCLMPRFRPSATHPLMVVTLEANGTSAELRLRTLPDSGAFRRRDAESYASPATVQGRQGLPHAGEPR